METAQKKTQNKLWNVKKRGKIRVIQQICSTNLDFLSKDIYRKKGGRLSFQSERILSSTC